jgi:triacylglycerol lipase
MHAQRKDLMHHLVLVPGFFGFGALGKLSYFAGVSEALAAEFARRELAVDIVEVPTLPTASIRHRAARVLETLAQVAHTDDGPVHVIAHSTGGLDARLAIAPTASLPTSVTFDSYHRIHSLATISTPHFGTPLASFFGSAMGYPLLRILASLAISALERGRLPLGAAIRLGRLVARLDDTVGLRDTFTDELYADLLEDFTEDRRKEVISFLQGVSGDQSLVFQLTPAGCDLLNACTADPTGVRYGSVVSRAAPPSASTFIRYAANPYAQYLYSLYTILHRVAGAGGGSFFPAPVAAQTPPLEKAFGAVPSHRESDGIVPTLSQVWGEVIHAARADHLDVVGHFGARRPGRVDSDWLPSASGFDQAAFDALWASVAEFVTREIVAPSAEVESVGTVRTDLDIEDAAHRTG